MSIGRRIMRRVVSILLLLAVSVVVVQHATNELALYWPHVMMAWLVLMEVVVK